MRTIWQALIWKEWHEHKWKLVSIVGILWCTTIVSLSQRNTDAFGLTIAILAFCLIPLSIFIGLGVAANERSRGTFAFTQALPTPIWRIALPKLITGLLVLIGSVVLTLPVFYAWAHLHDSGSSFPKAVNSAFTGNPYVDVVLICAPLAASFCLWSAASGVNRRDEVSAGAVALATMFFWSLILYLGGVCLYFWYKSTGTPQAEVQQFIQRFLAIAMSGAPAGFIPAFEMVNGEWNSSHEPRMRFLIAIVTIASIMHLALASWYVLRFGRISTIGIRLPQPAARKLRCVEWLGPPRKSALVAIAWKQSREIGPLVLACLACGLGIVLLVLVAQWSELLSHRDKLAYMASTVMVAIGYVVALIVGIGVCFYDVGPSLNVFWRSRPINPNSWFWVKFITGFIILVAALYLPILLIIFTIHPQPSQLLIANNVLSICMAHLALFAAAVAMTCLTRHAMYGAILSIPALYAGVFAYWMLLQLGGAFHFAQQAPSRLDLMTAFQVACGFFLTLLTMTVLAWLAIRNDWGKKSRY